jgi:hypothetical protein
MPDQNPLTSLDEYSRFAAELSDHPVVLRSTLRVWSVSPHTGVVEGEISFPDNLKLRVLEELDFADALITGYSYEVHQHGEKLYWYDDFPHPHDPDLASTHPHHKHIPPDIKNHRVPAPAISSDRPNLPVLIAEVEARLAEQVAEAETGTDF